ncbi:hypothetical protein SK128_015236 [Halocaridina rubra]|uniref:C1q domain-containing protein n=1 Tax=Halocaridina rubra TaxID=373956 RepID=A0AAN8WFF4_HALRR
MIFLTIFITLNALSTSSFVRSQRTWLFPVIQPQDHTSQSPEIDTQESSAFDAQPGERWRHLEEERKTLKYPIFESVQGGPPVKASQKSSEQFRHLLGPGHSVQAQHGERDMNFSLSDKDLYKILSVDSSGRSSINDKEFYDSLKESSSPISSTPTVAFSYRRSGGLTPSGLISFLEQIVNLNAKFSPENGIFCPEFSGIYLISYSVCAAPKSTVRLSLWHDQQCVVTSYGANHLSRTILIKLMSGELLYLKCCVEPFLESTDLKSPCFMFHTVQFRAISREY